MEVSPSLTVVHITEDRIGTNTCQVPLLRCETILVSMRRSLGKELRRKQSISVSSETLLATLSRSVESYSLGE
jgi:hypothetical protein